MRPLEIVERVRAALAERYRLERELGRGGMATVYLALDLKSGRRVALKVLRPELAASLGADRFLREIEIAAALQHPHILGLLDSGQADEVLYYTMPYVEGESLRGRLDREVQLELEQALAITREVADALDYAYRHGVVHRDIKPENILLSDGHAVVADFGIAKAVAAAGGARLTETGLSLGTPHYMSPEQAAAGDRIDGRSDIYSLGCVLYELLAGRPPFDGPTGQSVLVRHAVDPIPSLRTVRGTVPIAVERAISKSMAKVPADRFATASQFAAALAHGADGPVADGRDPGRRFWGALAAVTVGIALLAGLRTVVSGRGAGSPAAAGEGSIRTLAVAPFGNLTGDSTQVYLAQGITDQLITGLAQIGALKVIRLRDDTAALKMARDRGIDVDVVLAGSLQRVGEEVRITAQINSSTTGQAIWARSYKGQLRDILSLQDSVVRAVADTLRLALSPQSSTRLGAAAKRQVNPDAYEAYVRGVYFLGKVSEADFRKAIGYFQQAIDAEPLYAAAYTGVAACYAELGYYALGTPEETFPKARSAALKALEIDSTSGTAYALLGSIQLLYSWEFAAADRNFRRAIALDPRSPRVHLHYQVYLSAMDRPAEAIAEGRVSVELDPLSLLNQAAAARPYYMARRYEEAIAQAKRALEIDSTFSRAHYWLGMAYEQTARLPEAIREFEQTIRLAGPIPVYSAALGHAYAMAGQRGQARRILAELETRAKREYISPVDIAMIYGGLGERDQALARLEQGFAGRAYGLVFLARDPRFDALRADPRFTALMRRVGLPT